MINNPNMMNHLIPDFLWHTLNEFQMKSLERHLENMVRLKMYGFAKIETQENPKVGTEHIYMPQIG